MVTFRQYTDIFMSIISNPNLIKLFFLCHNTQFAFLFTILNYVNISIKLQQILYLFSKSHIEVPTINSHGHSTSEFFRPTTFFYKHGVRHILNKLNKTPPFFQSASGMFDYPLSCVYTLHTSF